MLCAPKTKEFGRILIIANRKVGKAVQRNKIRRQLKSIFYERKLYDQGYDCIVIVKKEAVGLPFEVLEELLCTVLERKNQV